jgi:UDP-glucose:(heptosyl)LPS alpha-1,3-glucosyltransferase
MRLALTIERLDLARGGAEVAGLRLIEELVRRGHQVCVMTEAVVPPLPEGVEVERIRLPFPSVALRQLSFVRRTARRLRSGRFDASVACGRGIAEDIIWAHTGSHPATMMGAVRTYYYNPLLRTLRRYQDRYSAKSWVYAWIERRCFARRPSPYLIAVSEMEAREYEQFYGVERGRIRVAYSLVDVRRFSPETRQPLRQAARARLGLKDESAILFVGQNFKRKGLRLLVEAAALLAQRGHSFRVLVGGGSLRQGRPYMALAEKLGCASAIQLLGPTRSVEEWYAAADIFCLPTFYDTFGMVVLEAMACGLPVVTSRFAGVSEVIQDGETGCLLAGAHDARELARRLEELLSPERRAAMGAAAVLAARETCRKNPAIDVASIVEELAARKLAEKKS